MVETNINIAQKGMNLDSAPNQVQSTEWTMANNANIQSIDSSVPAIGNEQSNLLCSTFKPGYNVIGTLPITSKGITIFFLVNPTTNDSEIGSINTISFEDTSDIQANCENCNSPFIEDVPLEQINQIPLCTYTTIINAPCLNFNINNPVRAEYSIGFDPNNNLPDNDSIVLYFTDGLNGQRWLNINNIPYLVDIIDEENCNTPIYSNKLDCSKILVNEPFTPPCITALETVIGGSLKGGTYQFTAAYANNIGVELTDYFIISSPVSISSVNNTITTNTDYITNQAIKINVSNLDSSLYNYINLVVLITTNQTTSIFQVGTYFVNSNTFTYTFTGNEYDEEDRLTIDDVLRKRPLYNTAKGVTKANEFLFWYGLEAKREINLQPFVSKLHPKWQVVEVNEDWYSNGVNVANTTGYSRDEVYPFAIYFKFAGGYTTADFPLVNNDAGYYLQNYTLLDTVDNTLNPIAPLDVNTLISDGNNISIQDCSAENLNKLWQVYNTAQDQGQNPLCPYSPTGLQTVYNYTFYSCNSENYTNDPVNPSGAVSTTNPYYYSQVNSLGTIIPNTQVYTYDGYTFFNTIGNTPFSSCGCTLPSGYNPSAISYIFNTLQIAQPNATVNVYPQTYCIHGITYAGYNPNYNGDPFGAGQSATNTGPQQVANSNLFVPQNFTCGSATQISTATTGACTVNPSTNQPNYYAYLKRITAPTQIYNPSGCSTCESCQGYSNCYTDNQVWYSFIATSKTHAIKLGLNGVDATSTESKFSLEVYENCLGGCPIACSSPSTMDCGIYLLVGDIASGQIGLTIGQTYYFRIFNPDPTTIGAIGLFGTIGQSPSGITWGYATVCVSTPTAIGTTKINIPGEYQFECTYESATKVASQVLINSDCQIQTYHRGDFAYWESVETYPNNPDVWGELCGKPIRHFKFPDERVSARYNTLYLPNDRTDSTLANQYSFNNKIYPIGITLDVKDVKNILYEATLQGYISDEERKNIVGYGIKRGNRRNNKSIVAKGMLYDLWKSNALNSDGNPIKDSNSIQSFESIYYPSYSYNDLNQDPFLLQKKGGQHINHPFYTENYKNGRYTFH